MRLMGVDWGGVRIGIAMGDSESGISSPRSALKAMGSLKKDAAQIDILARQEEAEAIAVGIPFSETDPRPARVCLQLVDHLRALGWVVHEVDESLTSVMAHEDLKAMGYSAAQRKSRIDGEAAVRVLLRFFQS
jgi:putative holliday junction resolvase